MRSIGLGTRASVFLAVLLTLILFADKGPAATTRVQAIVTKANVRQSPEQYLTVHPASFGIGLQILRPWRTKPGLKLGVSF